MGRGKKTPIEFIQNEKLRVATFHKHKLSLKKKLHEFKTLCDVDACMIVYGPPQKDGGNNKGVELDVFPANPSEVKDVVEKYITRASESSQKITASRNLNLADYYETRTRKLEDAVSKTKHAGYKAKYPVWDDRFNDASADQLIEILRLVEGKCEYVQLLSRIAEEKRRASNMAIYNGMIGHPVDKNVHQQHSDRCAEEIGQAGMAIYDYGMIEYCNDKNMPLISTVPDQAAYPVDQKVHQQHLVLNMLQQQYDQGNYHHQFDDFNAYVDQFSAFDGCADQGYLSNHMPPAASYSCDPVSLSGFSEHMAHNDKSGRLLEAPTSYHDFDQAFGDGTAYDFDDFQPMFDDLPAMFEDLPPMLDGEACTQYPLSC